MTDTTWLPNEIWANIATYLNDEDLARFRQVCKVTQFIGSHAILLQPLYNRLYALDKTLPALLPQDNALDAFKEAFLKIHTRQQEEIACLQVHCPRLISYPEYADVFAQNTSATLTSLEAKEAVLDKITEHHINSEGRGIGSYTLAFLNLKGLGITRLPASYFQEERNAKMLQDGISKIDCSDNALTSLNGLLISTTLQRLNCRNNQITTLNLQGLPALEYLECDNNPLIDLNLTGVHANIKNKYAELEQSLLWKQLGTATSIEKLHSIIVRLGENFSFENCLHYSPEQVDILFPDDAFPQETSYLPSFTSSAVKEMDEEFKNNKRARPAEEDDERPDDFKRMKKEG